MTAGYDVIIIGGGIIGAACASDLAAAGKKVIVLDAGRIAGGATSACMGHIVVMDDNEAEFQLSKYSQKLWHTLGETLSVDCWYDRMGAIWIASDDDEMEAAGQKESYYRERNLLVEKLNASTLYKYEPNLRAGLPGGLRVVNDCRVYSPVVTLRLLEGVEVKELCQVIGIGDHCVTLADGTELQGEYVINAAGNHAPVLTPELPIEPRKGHLVVTDRYPEFCQHQLVELGYIKSTHKMEKESVAFNIHPLKTGQYLIGSSRELAGFDDAINHDLVNRMLALAFNYVPSIKYLSMLRTWVGFRPVTPDNLPLIGEWPKTKGLYIAAGHEGIGITTSLGTAKLVTASILGQTPEIDPAPYDPARFLAGARDEQN